MNLTEHVTSQGHVTPKTSSPTPTIGAVDVFRNVFSIIDRLRLALYVFAWIGTYNFTILYQLFQQQKKQN